jgi:hypothetical protein
MGLLPLSPKFQKSGADIFFDVKKVTFSRGNAKTIPWFQLIFRFSIFFAKKRSKRDKEGRFLITPNILK